MSTSQVVDEDFRGRSLAPPRPFGSFVAAPASHDSDMPTPPQRIGTKSGPATPEDAARKDALPSVRVRLRQATAPMHHALEAGLDLLAPDLSRGRYRRVLEAFHGFHVVLEAELRRGPWTLGSVDLLPEPRRATLLRRDLIALGVRRRSSTGCPDAKTCHPCARWSKSRVACT